MRIGTWNLQQITPTSAKGVDQAWALQSAGADLWLLTEVDDRFTLVGHQITRSVPRARRSGHRWAAIASVGAVEPIPATNEGLAMALVHSPLGPLVAACSVLPWRTAAERWPGDPAMPAKTRFRAALDAQVAEIAAALESRPGAELVWGGDFNVALEGREWVGSMEGRELLLDAFGNFGVEPVTAQLSGARDDTRAIDHIAVSIKWDDLGCVAQIPTSPTGRPLSDHPLYIGVVEANEQRGGTWTPVFGGEFTDMDFDNPVPLEAGLPLHGQGGQQAVDSSFSSQPGGGS